MFRRIVIGLMLSVLLVGAASALAEKGSPAGKPPRRARTQKKAVAQKKARPATRQREQARPRQARGQRGRQQNLDIWFEKLTKAYRANDREQMGQLLRQMQQMRQRRRTQQSAAKRGKGVGPAKEKALAKYRGPVEQLRRPQLHKGKVGTWRQKRVRCHHGRRFEGADKARHKAPRAHRRWRRGAAVGRDLDMPPRRHFKRFARRWNRDEYSPDRARRARRARQRWFEENAKPDRW